MFDAGINNFEETVELPVNSLEECRALGRDLGKRLRAIIEARFTTTKGYDIEVFVSPEAQVAGVINHRNFGAEINTTVGQNARCDRSGELQAFYSLSVHAEASIPSVIGAEKLGEQIATWASLVGIAAGGGVLVLLLWVMARLTGYVVFSAWMVLGLLFLGGAAGGWVGSVIGGLIRRAKVAEAAGDPEVVEAVLDWQTLKEETTTLLGSVGEANNVE